MKLSDLVGSKILILSKWFSAEAEDFESVVLHGVEAGGIWIETMKINEAILQRFSTTMHDTTPVVFLPYHLITGIVSAVDKTLISERIAE